MRKRALRLIRAAGGATALAVAIPGVALAQDAEDPVATVQATLDNVWILVAAVLGGVVEPRQLRPGEAQEGRHELAHQLVPADQADLVDRGARVGGKFGGRHGGKLRC